MDIHLVCVGKLKSKHRYVQTGVDEYLKRLQAFASVKVLEVPDEAILKSKTTEQLLEKEAERLLPLMARASFIIALWEGGEQLDSIGFSQKWQQIIEKTNPPNGGARPGASGPIILLVGGPFGLSPKILKQADWVVSLSKLTFAHPHVRLIVLEQLMRAFKIIRNEPYQK